MAAARANWKGYLRLSLVSCPIALYPATSESEKVRFNQLNKNAGNRIRYSKVDAETGEEVDSEDIIKGYQVSKRPVHRNHRRGSGGGRRTGRCRWSGLTLRRLAGLRASAPLGRSPASIPQGLTKPLAISPQPSTSQPSARRSPRLTSAELGHGLVLEAIEL